MALEPADRVAGGSSAARRACGSCRCPARRRAGAPALGRPRSRRRPCAGARPRSRGRRGRADVERGSGARPDEPRRATGSARPLTSSSPSGSNVNRCARRRAVSSPTAIVPGAAADWRRAATLTASPSATVCGLSAPTGPTPARPVLIPTRTAKSGIAHASAMSCAYSPTTSRIRSAVRAARSGSSSCACGTPKYGADPVALVGLDRAAVLLDRLAHLRHALAHERLHVLGREPLAERGRADDVGEQGGDGAQLVPGRRGARRRRRRRGARSVVAASARQRRVLPEDGRLEVA